MRTSVKVLLAALAALVLTAGVGFTSWTMATSRAESAAATQTANLEVEVGAPTIVTSQQMADFSFSHYPMYWLGEQPDTQLELTLTSNGSVFVRYLPQDVDAGDDGEFLTVATYRAMNGYEGLMAADAEIAAVEQAQSGAVVVVFNDRPLSTYFSFENAAFQVEVFSPDEGRAKQLTDDGVVVLAGEELP